LAETLLAYFNFGSIQVRKSQNAVLWIVNSLSGIIFITKLINGCMRTPKIEALHKLIDWLNDNVSNCNISKLPLDTSSLGNNGWLAGFSEGDGYFEVRSTPKTAKSYQRISTSFSITQSRVDLEVIKQYFNVMVFISSFFGSTCKVSDRGTKGLHYIARTVSLNGAGIAYNYFLTYPLLSSKYLDFLAWSEVYLMILDKQHLTLEAFQHVQSIKGSMNKNRTEFNWDHLNSFKILYHS